MNCHGYASRFTPADDAAATDSRTNRQKDRPGGKRARPEKKPSPYLASMAAAAVAALRADIFEGGEWPQMSEWNARRRPAPPRRAG